MQDCTNISTYHMNFINECEYDRLYVTDKSAKKKKQKQNYRSNHGTDASKSKIYSIDICPSGEIVITLIHRKNRAKSA